jgi:UPF0271 protein
MIKTIDLNSDVGERPEALLDGSEEKLISLITSANIACGGHVGDEESMKMVLKLCAKHNVAVGAHPSYPDRESFGRKKLDISLGAVAQSVYEQVLTLCNLADNLGLQVSHVKPHGALYNAAANDETLAGAISDGVKKVGKDFVLFGLAGSMMLKVWAAEGFTVVGEAFVDRRYEPDGSLRSRTYSDALITDPRLAANQAIKLVREHCVTTTDGSEITVPAKTLCLHSDTPSAIQIASEVRSILLREGIRVEAIARV